MAGHKAVVLFYKYFVSSWCPDAFADCNAEWYVDRLEEYQRSLCHALGCQGRILISVEGINGTLSGADECVIQEYISKMQSFHLQRDCGLPPHLEDDQSKTCRMDDERNYLFRDVDWKESSVEDGILEPFPDLKISIVKEIVSTGGQVKVDDIPDGTGKHLTPTEFHEAMGSSEKPVVVIDVRNTFEHDIGHFVLPKTGEAALNPEMVTFSSFDSNFCAQHAEELKDKKVLMYCTGGIRCEKASVMLRKRGVDDVNQLEGGIHRYLETFGNGGYYKGLNFVFDQRVAMKPDPKLEQNEVVGRCVQCDSQFDKICGSRVCTVCRDLVLVCPTCQSALREYHCRRHSSWKDCFFTFLDVFDVDELKEQIRRLKEVRSSLMPSSAHRNQRRTLSRQIEKLKEQVSKLEAGSLTTDRNSPRRCRTCMEPSTICNGRCWGFWKGKSGEDEGQQNRGVPEDEILGISVGDIVAPSDQWNPMRLGERADKEGKEKRGTVTEIKGWSGSDNARDCVVVLWDDGVARGRNQAKLQPQIYKWGVVALDGSRMYDVRRISSN